MAVAYFADQTSTGFAAVFTFDNDPGVAFELSHPLRFSGSDFTYDADGTPLDGMFTQVTFGVEYVLNEGDETEVVPALFYTGPTQDLSDLLDLSSSPEQALSLMLFGLSLAATDRLEGDAGLTIIAEATGGRTTGSRDNDVFRVSDDSSWFNAGWGDDYMIATDGPVQFKGQAGDDVMIGGEAADSLRGGSGHDSVEGGAGNDKIYGQGGNDALRGGDGDDWVLGGSGRDYLIAGAGRDQMHGGSGADMFVFNIATAETPGYAHKAEEGRNVVRDFDVSEDILRFGYGYNNTLTQADAFTWFSEHAVDHKDHVRIVDGDVRIIIKNMSVAEFELAHFAGNDTHGSYDDWLLG